MERLSENIFWSAAQQASSSLQKLWLGHTNPKDEGVLWWGDNETLQIKDILEETVNKLNYSEEGQKKKNPEIIGSLTIKPIDHNHVISVTQEKYDYI